MYHRDSWQMESWAVVIFFLASALLTNAASSPDYSKEKDPKFWHQKANDELHQSLKRTPVLGRAKNVILFIGDGMGPTTVTAGRILEGQERKHLSGEDNRLSFDQFPYTGLSVTYNVNTQITDSAASATAYTSGVKTNQGLLGVNAKVTRGNCSSATGAEVTSILRWFKDNGRSAGVVTTTTVTHATPGSTYAHSADRDWEVDRWMSQQAKEDGCHDIAFQLVKNNSDINVVMGGGMNHFKPQGYVHPHPDTDPYYASKPKRRNDSRDLVEEWKAEKKKENAKHLFVSNSDELKAADVDNIDYLFGLFAEFHMSYAVEQPKWEPSLADMTEKAIKLLQKNDKGFYLMVEGGRIDHGHHITQPSKALHDVMALSDAVAKAVSLTDEKDTLILVTADHSHTMSIAGYAKRGNPILAKSGAPNRPSDKMPYTTILYGNGPGYNSSRQNLTLTDTENQDYVSQSAVPMHSETHGGEDVVMYARGPQSYLYAGVHEQNYIPMLMAYAACVGPYQDESQCAPELVNGSPVASFSHLVFLVTFSAVAFMTGNW